MPIATTLATNSINAKKTKSVTEINLWNKKKNASRVEYKPRRVNWIMKQVVVKEVEELKRKEGGILSNSS